MPEMPFEPGKSGNPAGKLKGTRNKTTLAVEALLDGEAETITTGGAPIDNPYMPTREQPKPENITKVSFSRLITKTCLS
jgi:hypothetical protein